MESKEIAVSNVDLNNPADLVSFAKTLKDVIVNERLFTEITNKGVTRKYVNVEGWQFAGGAMGIVPVVKSVEQLNNTEPIEYRAEVKLVHLATGNTVGYGVAICSGKEKSKQYADEFVIASMAQTRAIGKAYRNTFAWLMKLAGYEVTQAEEMGEFVNKGKE